MRFLTTLLLWLVTTVALAATIPALWAQQNIVDEHGYADLAAAAAHDPMLQQAMADELADQFTAWAADRGYQLDRSLVGDVARSYTGNAGFPAQFAQANRIAHRWMFTDTTPQGDAANQWLIDIAPMLSDPSFRETVGNLDLEVPETLTVPITVPTDTLRPGRLATVATWGPWLTIAAAVLTALLALLTVAAARARGKAIAALGVSALLVGGSGWAAVEVLRGHIGDALNHTDSGLRQVAEVMVNQAEDSLHHWLNLTLLGGGGLVAFGVVVAMLGSVLGGKRVQRREPG
ncbi:hypothetical protein [Mycolicibacterium thermoresistibile]